MKKWQATGWTPKGGNQSLVVEAVDIKKALKKAQKEMKVKGSGEVTVTPWKPKKGSSVKSTPKETKEKVAPKKKTRPVGRS